MRRRTPSSGYWGRVFSRAAGDTFEFLGGRKILFPPAIFVLAVAAQAFVGGINATLGGLVRAALLGALPVAAFYGILFLLLLARTPRVLEQEAFQQFSDELQKQDQQIRDLERRILDRQQRQDAINTLWDLRARGVDHRNAHIQLGDYDGWQQSYVEWRESVLAAAERASESLRKFLTTLDHMGPMPLGLTRQVHDSHELERHVMSEMLLRMQEFLEADMLDKDIRRIGR